MPGAGPVCAGVMPRAVQCGLLGVMKAVSSPAQPAGGHTTPADNSVQTIPADNSADKSVRWSDVRTTHFSDQMYIQFLVAFFQLYFIQSCEFQMCRYEIIIFPVHNH